MPEKPQYLTHKLQVETFGNVRFFDFAVQVRKMADRWDQIKIGGFALIPFPRPYRGPLSARNEPRYTGYEEKNG